MAMQKNFKQGCRWQVGNGASIGIWTDKWLPKPSTFKLISPPNNTFERSRSSDLIDPLKCEWQTDLVRQIFLPPNVQSILSIFFSSYLPQDQLVWAYTPKEKFTVRSAYKIALDRNGTRIQSWGGPKYKYKKAYENQNYHLLRIMHNHMTTNIY